MGMYEDELFAYLAANKAGAGGQAAKTEVVASSGIKPVAVAADIGGLDAGRPRSQVEQALDLALEKLAARLAASGSH